MREKNKLLKELTISVFVLLFLMGGIFLSVRFFKKDDSETPKKPNQDIPVENVEVEGILLNYTEIAF